MPQSVLLRQTMLLQQSHGAAAHSRPGIFRQRRRLRVSARLAPPKVVVSEHFAGSGSSIQLAAGTTAAAVTSSVIGPHASKHNMQLMSRSLHVQLLPYPTPNHALAPSPHHPLTPCCHRCCCCSSWPPPSTPPPTVHPQLPQHRRVCRSAAGRKAAQPAAAQGAQLHSSQPAGLLCARR